ncbi:DUF58 domain-containing protein [Candidatus Woesearchaeota archaeon]|jgi:uncharacterized protein (DUF58 family)|nr:DUF58 domain-containing protein [Candidatus Woesearchaeota archaeon]
MIDLEFIKDLNRFSIMLKKRIHSNYSGVRQSRRFGSGLVFYDYRQYVPGDDFRAIDWKVYARTNDLYIKRFEEERNMSVHVIVDASASMDFGAKIKKFEYASMVALGFCHMALKNNERFEISTFAEDLKVFKAHKGMSKLISSFYTLQDIKPDGKSLFAESLKKYKAIIKHKAFVVIVSDFLFDLNQLKEILPLFKKSDVLCVQVLDEEEIKPLFKGDVLLEDSETKDRLKTFISNRFKETYSKALSDHLSEIRSLCGDLNIRFATVSTDTPIFDAFYEMLAK